MEENKNKYKIVLTYAEGTDGEVHYDRIYIMDMENKSVLVDEPYDANKYSSDAINEFLRQNGVEGNNTNEVLENALNMGVFDVQNSSKYKVENEFAVGNETVDIPSNNGDDEHLDPTDPFDTNTDDEFDNGDVFEDGIIDGEKDSHPVRNTLIAAGAVAAGLGAIAAISNIVGDDDVVKNNNNTNNDNNTNNNNNQNATVNEIRELINSLNGEGKAFFNDVLDSLLNVNGNLTNPNNFKLETDKTDLQFTAEEMIAAKIAFNNYTPEQLFNIFGTTSKIGSLSLDATSIDKAMDTVYLKLATYGMNATMPSGMSSLIEDSNAREFFEKHENVVLDFNKNPSTATSDAVLKALYHDFTYEGMTGSYADINNDNVARMATAFHYGNMLATRNVPDYNEVHSVSDAEKTQYGDAAIEVGLQRATLIADSDILQSVLEDRTFVMSEELNQKSLCYKSLVELTERMNSFDRYKEIKLAILDSDTEKYADTKAELAKRTETLGKIVSMTNNGLDYNSHDDIIALINNRFLPVPVKEDAKDKFDNLDDTAKDVVAGSDDNGDIVVDKDKFDNLPQEEKDKVIPQVGEKVDEKTETKEEVVQKEDLTQEEQKQVAKEEEILEKLDDLYEYFQLAGIKDANNYIENASIGKYERSITNPYNNQVINTKDMSLFNVVAHETAFGDGSFDINHNDSQYQNYLDKEDDEIYRHLDSLDNDSKKYLLTKHGNDWQDDIVNQYYNNVANGEFDNEIKNAKAMGAQLRKSAEEAAKKFEEENKSTIVVDDANNNKQEDDTNKTDTPATDNNQNNNSDNQNNNYDPNIDPNYQSPGEMPWTPPEIDMPVYEYESVKWDDVFSSGAKVKK